MNGYGICQHCGKQALLGDGLCVSCYDNNIDGKKKITNPYYCQIHNTSSYNCKPCARCGEFVGKGHYKRYPYYQNRKVYCHECWHFLNPNKNHQFDKLTLKYISGGNDLLSESYKTRQTNRKKGETRTCIVCSKPFYVRLSKVKYRPNGFILCPTCNKILLKSRPPKPIWINNKRYGLFDKCPLCDEYLFWHFGCKCNDKYTYDGRALPCRI